MPLFKFRPCRAETPRMYRCWHCKCLHFASHQARACAEVGDLEAFTIEELSRRVFSVPWPLKYEWRRRRNRTEAEGRLWDELEALIPRDCMLVEWWLDELDYRVDFLIEPAKLVIEVDGPSHRGREREDRYRSMLIREADYEIVRVTNEDVMARAGLVASRIAWRVRLDLDEGGVRRDAAA